VNLRPLIPIKAGMKGPPLMSAWQTMSHADLEAAVGACEGQYPNYGLRLDHYIALDPDDEKAIDLLQGLEDDGLLPPTLTWETWRGHPVRLYCARADVPKTIQYKRGIKLEVRTSSGNYCLVPPSVVNGKEYRIIRDDEPSLLPKDALAELARRVAEITAKIKPEPEFGRPAEKGINPEIPLVTLQDGSRNNDIYTIALSLFLQGWSMAGVANVCLAAAKGCNPPFPENEVHTRVASAYKASLQRDQPIAKLVREWVRDMSGGGVFTVQDVMRELALEQSRKVYQRIHHALGELRVAGDVVPAGNKRGQFRRVNNDAPRLDIMGEAVTPLAIKWPLGLHKAINFYEGNIAVIAGETNCGKTAYLLNLVKDNLEEWGNRIRYMTSEGGVQELRSRLNLFGKEFGMPIERWMPVDWRERYDNFADLIHPDFLNIVDYMEVNDEFWRIGEPIKEIAQRLEKGIAVIAVQKKRGERMGRGGEFAAQRPRLYCTIGKDPKSSNLILKMEKGKARVSDAFDTMGGYNVTFRIRNGVKLEKIQEEVV
jgi:hypothetical protein